MGPWTARATFLHVSWYRIASCVSLATVLACSSGDPPASSPPGASGSAGAPSAGGGGPACTLLPSGPVSSSAAGEVIENLHITSTSGTALSIVHDDVVVRNVWVEHASGPGIDVNGARGVRIASVVVEHTGAPASGQNPSSGLSNIQAYQARALVVDGARLVRGSSGIYLIESPGSELRNIEGHDFRGPFPRGQVVQWDKSDDGLLDGFSVINPPGSWPEDSVNVYQSSNVTIRNGLIDGNNSPTGVGVIFDGGTASGLVEDVDALRMGNGCFSNYDGAEGTVFRRTRCRDNICEGQDGRNPPTSNALMWAGREGLATLRIEDSTYFNACNPGNVVWPEESFELIEIQQADFIPRAPVELTLCWE